jgi:neutral ceramidase
MASLHAGASKVKITPALGTPIGGNARLDNYARGVLQDIYARALFLDDVASAVCLLSLDLLGLLQPDADRLREAVSVELQIPFSNVMIACTHTHSGPDTFQTLCWNEDKLTRDTELLKPFWDELPGKLREVVSAAKRNAQPATMQFATAENREIANNRRLRMKTGETRMNWELPPAEQVEAPLGPIDPQVAVITFNSGDGKIVGGIVHYACHPAILAGANSLMSGDYVGIAMAELEEKMGCPAMLFLQGASGNVNHINYRHPERGRDTNEVHRCADSLVGSVVEAWEKINHRDTEAQSNTEIAIRSENLLLPIREISEEQFARANDLLAKYDGRDLSMADGVPPEMNARRTVKLVEAARTGKYEGRFAKMREGKVVLPLQVIRVGDVVLAAVPAEIFVEFGFRFREELASTGITADGARWRTGKSAPLSLLVGLANGACGYVPTPQAFSEGGYEPTLGPNYLPENAGNEIIDTLLRLAMK